MRAKNNNHIFYNRVFGAHTSHSGTPVIQLEKKTANIVVEEMSRNDEGVMLKLMVTVPSDKEKAELEIADTHGNELFTEDSNGSFTRIFMVKQEAHPNLVIRLNTRKGTEELDYKIA